MADKRTPEFWFKQLDREDKKFKKWRERGQKVVDRYRDERSQEKQRARKFNLLWSNVEVLKPAVYSKTPVPDVRRRFLDNDPVARHAAEIIERVLVFELEDYDFDVTMERCRDDGLLAGRGVACVEYEADTSRERLEQRDGKYYRQEKETEPDERDEEGGAYSVDVTDERVRCKYIPWRLFRHTPVPLWEKVWWVAIGEPMTKADIRKNFGAAIANEVRFEETEDEDEDKGTGRTKPTQGIVWKIWDRETGKIYFVMRGLDKWLREPKEPPFTLKGFFPCPPPYTPIRTTDNPVPVPEYTEYQDQIEELDKLTARINRLIDAIKAKGAYPSALGSTLANILEGDENQLVPVDDWETLAQLSTGDLSRAIAWLPVEPLAKVVVLLAQRRQELKQEIYEITGISDIIRGTTKASETATAQEIKGNFGTLRMTPRSKPFARFARDVIRLKAEIIAENYSPETLKRITGFGGKDVPPPTTPEPEAIQQWQAAVAEEQRKEKLFMDAVQLLRDEGLRSFRIDIETDSTIAPDQEADKAATVEFVTAITQFLSGAAEIGAAVPQLIPLLMEILKAAASRFKMGRQLEDKINEAVQRMEQAANSPQPNPEAEKAKMELAIKEQESKAEIERKNAEAQQKMALEERKFAHEQKMAEQEHAFRARELAFKEEEHAMKRDIMQRDADAKANQAMMATAEHEEKIAGLRAERAAPEMQGAALKEITEAVAALSELVKQMQAAASKPRSFTAKKGPKGDWSINAVQEMMQ